MNLADDEVNKFINGMLAAAARDAKQPGAKKTFAQIVQDKFIGQPLLSDHASGIARIEHKLEEYLRTKNLLVESPAIETVEEKVVGTVLHKHRTLYRPSPVVRLCGHCVGLDKIGHYFEEGLIHHQVANMKDSGGNTLGGAYATALHYWLEGLYAPGVSRPVYDWLNSNETLSINWAGSYRTIARAQLWGMFGDWTALNQPLDKAGSASTADIAAGIAGGGFWSIVFGLEQDAPLGQFNICKVITDASWDHIVNPNKPGGARFSGPPAFVQP